MSRKVEPFHYYERTKCACFMCLLYIYFPPSKCSPSQKSCWIWARETPTKSALWRSMTSFRRRVCSFRIETKNRIENLHLIFISLYEGIVWPRAHKIRVLLKCTLALYRTSVRSPSLIRFSHKHKDTTHTLTHSHRHTSTAWPNIHRQF